MRQCPIDPVVCDPVQGEQLSRPDISVLLSDSAGRAQPSDRDLDRPARRPAIGFTLAGPGNFTGLGLPTICAAGDPFCAYALLPGLHYCPFIDPDNGQCYPGTQRRHRRADHKPSCDADGFTRFISATGRSGGLELETQAKLLRYPTVGKVRCVRPCESYSGGRRYNQAVGSMHSGPFLRPESRAF